MRLRFLRRLGEIPIVYLWLALPFVAILGHSFHLQLGTLDFWWHLKAGEAIWQTGTIPRVDEFSSTAAGETFILQNWLAELLLYLVHRAGGPQLVIFLNGLLLAATLLPIFLVCTLRLGRTRWAAAACLLSGVALYALSPIRPQIFSFLGFSIIYWILWRDRHYSGTRALWVLPVLIVFWANFHGGFPICFILLAAFLAGTGLEWPAMDKSGRIIQTRQLKRLLIVSLLCAVATLVNPEGFRIWNYVHEVLTDPTSQQLVTEWQPPRITETWPILLLYLPLFSGFVLFSLARHRPNALDYILFLGFGALAITAARNVIWFTLVAPAILAQAAYGIPWKTLFGWSSAEEPVTGQTRISPDRPMPLFTVVVLVSFLAATVPQVPWLRLALKGSSPEELLLDRQIPIGAVRYLEQHGKPGNIFNEQAFGDYIIWSLWPKYRSFFDGRVHLFRKIARDYTIMFHDSCWEKRLEPFNVRYLMLYPESELLTRVRQTPGWEVVFEDERAVLVERR